MDPNAVWLELITAVDPTVRGERARAMLTWLQMGGFCPTITGTDSAGLNVRVLSEAATIRVFLIDVCRLLIREAEIWAAQEDDGE